MQLLSFNSFFWIFIVVWFQISSQISFQLIYFFNGLHTVCIYFPKFLTSFLLEPTCYAFHTHFTYHSWYFAIWNRLYLYPNESKIRCTRKTLVIVIFKVLSLATILIISIICSYIVHDPSNRMEIIVLINVYQETYLLLGSALPQAP